LAQTGMPVTLVGSHSGGCGGPNGKTHQALNDIAVMASLPNVDVWAPGSDRDTQFVMQEIIKAARPAYIRYPRESWGELPGTAAACRWIGARRRFALVSCGFFTQIALQAAMHLRDGGIDIGVIHLTRLAPFPAIELAAALTNVESLWVAEDHAHFGGLADPIRSNGFSVEEPVFGWPANWAGGVGPASELLRQHALTPDLIADRIAKKLSKGN